MSNNPSGHPGSPGPDPYGHPAGDDWSTESEPPSTIAEAPPPAAPRRGRAVMACALGLVAMVFTMIAVLLPVWRTETEGATFTVTLDYWITGGFQQIVADDVLRSDAVGALIALLVLIVGTTMALGLHLLLRAKILLTIALVTQAMLTGVLLLAVVRVLTAPSSPQGGGSVTVTTSLLFGGWIALLALLLSLASLVSLVWATTGDHLRPSRSPAG